MFCALNRFSDGFIGMATMGIHMTLERLMTDINHSFKESMQLALCGHHNIVTCELMVHPGYRCQGFGGCGGHYGPDCFACSSDREHELTILSSQDMQTFYHQNHIQLVADIV